MKLKKSEKNKFLEIYLSVQENEKKNLVIFPATGNNWRKKKNTNNEKKICCCAKPFLATSQMIL